MVDRFTFCLYTSRPSLSRERLPYRATGIPVDVGLGMVTILAGKLTALDRGPGGRRFKSPQPDHSPAIDYLVNAKRRGRDSLVAWSTDVRAYIAKGYPERLRARGLAMAQEMSGLMEPRSAIMRMTEDGSPITSIHHAVLHEREGGWRQKQPTGLPREVGTVGSQAAVAV